MVLEVDLVAFEDVNAIHLSHHNRCRNFLLLHPQPNPPHLLHLHLQHHSHHLLPHSTIPHDLLHLHLNFHQSPLELFNYFIIVKLKSELNPHYFHPTNLQSFLPKLNPILIEQHLLPDYPA